MTKPTSPLAVDWSDGSYELTAPSLEPAAQALVDALTLTADDSVLDVGCGTGNVALLAAQAGARVVGVDRAERLLDVARRRLADDGLGRISEFVAGDVTDLPFSDDGFDAAASNFALIFADDPDRAASEVCRVVRPGGRVALTSWLPTGAIYRAGRVLREAVASDAATTPARLSWSERQFARDVFGGAGTVVITERSLAFRHSSAEAWLTEIEDKHPAWRAVRTAIGDQSDAWRDAHERSLAILLSENESSSAFEVTSRYLLITVTLND